MLAFALCYIAFGLFALGQPVHLKSVDPLAPVPAPSGQKRHKLLALGDAAQCRSTQPFVHPELEAGLAAAYGASCRLHPPLR
jgi:hypothetical protein